MRRFSVVDEEKCLLSQEVREKLNCPTDLEFWDGIGGLGTEAKRVTCVGGRSDENRQVLRYRLTAWQYPPFSLGRERGSVLLFCIIL